MAGKSGVTAAELSAALKSLGASIRTEVSRLAREATKEKDAVTSEQIQNLNDKLDTLQASVSILFAGQSEIKTKIDSLNVDSTTDVEEFQE